MIECGKYVKLVSLSLNEVGQQQGQSGGRGHTSIKDRFLKQFVKVLTKARDFQD